MKAMTNSTVPAFDLDKSLATQCRCELFVAMQSFASRVHDKIEIMLSRNTISAGVGIAIDDEDKKYIAIALESEHNGLSNQQIITLKSTASAILNCHDKILLSYEQAEQLFLTLRG